MGDTTHPAGTEGVEAVDVVLAVDVGGTRLKSALVDRDLRVVVADRTRTPPDPPAQLAQAITSTREELVRQAQAFGTPARVVAAGVVAPGIVDDAIGTVVLAVNLGLDHTRLAATLSEGLSLPVRLGHDVRAGLLAEARLGAARDARNVLFVPLGTGVAGAMMIDGRSLVAGGWAGELGHVVVVPGGRLCNCGNRGCLETVSSASAVERAYREASGQRVEGDALRELVAAGDPVAGGVWQNAVEALAYALANTITLLGLELVVVGGGLVGAGATLLDPLREAIERRLTFQRRPRVVAAELGDRAGMLGAAILGWQLV